MDSSLRRAFLLLLAIAFALDVTAQMRAQTPPARPQFDVASVRPVANDETRADALLRVVMRNRRTPGMIPMTAPDRVRLQNWPLLDLIAAAYSVRATQVSGPDWLSGQGFDIEATVPDGTPKEELNAMLQSLLEERFGLKVHRSTKTGQGFALVLGKDGTKLKSAQPPPAPGPELTDEEKAEQRAQLQEKMLADMRKHQQEDRESVAARGALSTWSSDSITTEDLAAELVQFAGAPVVDETGLTGKYSVSVKTWQNADVPGGTIFDAVEKLGLKLEPRKVTVETVVVDQVSKTPTPN
jgi:uncharacterized protein (TIGR03435 family)